jgi:hypothetical protein
MRRSLASCWLGRLAGATLLLAGLWGGVAAWGQPAADLDDEAFIVRLEEGGADDVVDRRRLARLFYGIAATLEGGKSSVRLLGSAIRVPAPARENAASAVAVRYADYATALDGLGLGAGRLLDSPESATALYRYLAGAHRACWQLDAYTRTVENYGARNQDLMSILSSIEACARFRRVAYLPAVEGIVARELEQTERLRGESRALRDELAEIERLLDDLRRLDADSPD